MNTNTTLRACPRCGEACEAELLRLQHPKAARSCPACGFTARPSLFRALVQPATNGRVAHADQLDAGADGAAELNDRLCRKLDRVSAILALVSIIGASADVVLGANLVRLVVR